MRGMFLLIGIFGLVINGWLYLHGGLMPILLIVAVFCLIAAVFSGGGDTTG